MSVKKILLAQYDLHQVLFNNVVTDISNEESETRVVDSMNNTKWLAGHLLWAQDRLADIAGVKIETPWNVQLFGRTTPDSASELPTIQMIVDKWNEYAPLIREGLTALSDETLDTVIDVRLPITPFDNTVGGRWAFINHHQAYTIGQIGILRRGLGKEGMKYF